MNRPFERGVAIATFLSALSIVPRHCACLTYLPRRKLRTIHAALIALKLLPLPCGACVGASVLGTGGALPCACDPPGEGRREVRAPGPKA